MPDKIALLNRLRSLSISLFSKPSRKERLEKKSELNPLKADNAMLSGAISPPLSFAATPDETEKKESLSLFLS